MLPRDITSILPADVVALVADGVRESRRVDFKRDLYDLDGATSEVKSKAHRELMADVVAFANSEGGDIVIGVGEENEVAVAAEGVDADRAAAFERKLANYWQNDVEPPLHRIVDSRVILHPASPGRAFVLIRIRPSPNAPHRTAGERHFYDRTGAQKNRMDMPRIRESFLLQDIAYDAFEAFRRERTARLASQEHKGHAWVVLHIAPISALTRGSRQQLEFKTLEPRKNLSLFDKVDIEHYTASGFVRGRLADEERAASGYHVFYDGRYEVYRGGETYAKTRYLHLAALMQAIAIAANHYGQIQRQLGEIPLLAAVTAVDLTGSVLNMDGVRLTQPSRMAPGDIVWCPEIRMESMPSTPIALATELAPSLLPFFLAYNLEEFRMPLAERAWGEIEPK